MLCSDRYAYTWSNVIPSNTLATTEITEMGRSLFISLELPGLNKGVTFSVIWEYAVVKEQLKILQIEMQIKSAHSRISPADILSRPVTFDLLSLFNSENTWLLFVGVKQNLWSVMLRYSKQLLSPLAADGISLATFGPIVEKCSLNAFAKSVVWFIETPFIISSSIEGVLLLQDVSSLIVCQVRREPFLCSVDDCL